MITIFNERSNRWMLTNLTEQWENYELNKRLYKGESTLTNQSNPKEEVNNQDEWLNYIQHVPKSCIPCWTWQPTEHTNQKIIESYSSLLPLFKKKAWANQKSILCSSTGLTTHNIRDKPLSQWVKWSRENMILKKGTDFAKDKLILLSEIDKSNKAKTLDERNE